ncbi:MAG TPA: PAS domain S-box protein [Vicinamibacterales bacterium]|nr:PAS domain S-box protein [Vicinamibacterales bacterium]
MPDRPALEPTIAMLEAALEASRDAILVVDLDRQILRYNQRYLEMFGFTAAELAGGGVDHIIATIAAELDEPDGALAMSEAIWAVPSAERLDVMRFKDGRVIERFVAPLVLGAGIVGRTASFRNISAAIRTAELLAQHQTFLEQAQEVAHIGSWVAELDGSDRLDWSAEAHRIFGVPAGQFAGSSEAFFAFVHPDDRIAVRAASEAAAAGGPAYDVEHRVVRPDGSVRWVHEKASRVGGAQGRPLRMVGTVQDITDRRLLEDQLRQSQKMEAIGRLAGGIAHDLNNALTAIAGYAELALGEVASDHAARADVEEIRRAAERAGSVTRQLLAFSRKQLLEPRVFDLNATVAAISRLLSRLLGADVDVKVRLAGTALLVLGDPGQVEQAVINLALNARDAMPDGGTLVLATGQETVDDAYARGHPPMPTGLYTVLRVSDSGHGMPRETQTRIFEPFFTTKEVGKGTGLGLSMVYGTLKQIGGFIFVDSEVNRGTTFRLFFPPTPTLAAAGADGGAREQERRGHETLLVVEDEPSVRNLVASALRHDGYRLLIASSAEEALAAADAHQGPIDLLLTDAMMPGKSGFELANLMASRRPGIPVIVMSGYTEETLDVAGLKNPIVLLQKPFTPRELRRRIREVLDR